MIFHIITTRYYNVINIIDRYLLIRRVILMVIGTFSGYTYTVIIGTQSLK